MKYSDNIATPTTETDWLYVCIGETRYRMREKNGKLNISKSAEDGDDTIVVYPQAANVIEIH